MRVFNISLVHKKFFPIAIVMIILGIFLIGCSGVIKSKKTAFDEIKQKKKETR